MEEAAFKDPLSWLHSNFMANKAFKGYLTCYNGQSQFSFLCRYSWEIIILITTSGHYFKEKPVILTMIMWFACLH